MFLLLRNCGLTLFKKSYSVRSFFHLILFEVYFTLRYWRIVKSFKITLFWSSLIYSLSYSPHYKPWSTLEPRKSSFPWKPFYTIFEKFTLQRRRQRMLKDDKFEIIHTRYCERRRKPKVIMGGYNFFSLVQKKRHFSKTLRKLSHQKISTPLGVH